MPEYTNNLKCGLWQKTSAKGNPYKSGLISINGVEYWVSIFDNSEKQAQNPKAPGEQMILNPKDGGGSTHATENSGAWPTDQDSPF